MKICTNIEQSKKLAEFLPKENADMYWWSSGKRYYIESIDDDDYEEDKDIRAWSLAALLSILPFHLIVNNQRYTFNMIKGLDKNGETYAIKYAIFNTTFYFHLTDAYDNPVDACYEMILKLNELNLL
jgi:hypothetical protein